MSCRRTVIAWGSIILAASCLLAIREWQRLSDGHTHISFFDVGQGDSALIETPSGKQVLIDGGPDWSTLERLGETLPFFDRSIDMVVISHAHLDHIASLPELLRRYDVGTLVISGVGNEGPWMRRVLAAAKTNGTRTVQVVAGQTIDLGDGLTFQVLWPPVRLAKQFTSNLNNASVVLKLRSGTHSVLFAGDAEKMVEDTLVAAHADLRAEILKVGHHGSKTSSSTGFLLAVKPISALVSVGNPNSFGHPNLPVLRRLRDFGATVHRTDTEGTWRVEW